MHPMPLWRNLLPLGKFTMANLHRRVTFSGQNFTKTTLQRVSKPVGINPASQTFNEFKPLRLPRRRLSSSPSSSSWP